MTAPERDAWAMQRALQLAEQALYITTPNPRVGAVLLAPDGQVIGEGHTQPAGQAHAEIMALRDAASRGQQTQGATMYVTLEPCSHHGRTPPCTDAIIAAGIARVVVALPDPHPKVAGTGFGRLRAAGIEVEQGQGFEESLALNTGFVSRHVRGRPWVWMKVAQTVDARTALPDGRSQWITSEAARTDGHAWRARACAVLTGIGTVLADDPRLDVRLVSTARQPLRVLIDRDLQLPPTARLLEASGGVRLYHATDENHWTAEQRERVAALQDRGVSLVYCKDATNGKVDLPAVFADLMLHDLQEIHVEAGERLNGSLLQAGCIDEALIYVAPHWLGPGIGSARLPVASDLSRPDPWEFLEPKLLSPDLRLRMHRKQAWQTLLEGCRQVRVG